MAIAALATGRVATGPMITHTMGIDDLPKAFAALALPTDQSKVMVEF
jgi:threonine dehydrogenase-like Zn-dependent dehydrogenase